MMNRQINMRMEKRIYWAFLLFTAIAVICAGVLAVSVGLRQSMIQAKQSICDQTEAVSAAYTYMTQDEFIDMLGQLPEKTRATLIAQDGTVFYDSYADIAQMENHLNRPEVQQAIESGVGEITRTSSTLKETTYYYAVCLPDGNVLRLAQQYSTIRSTLAGSIPGIFVIIVLMVALALIISRGLTVWMIRPVEQAAKALKHNEDSRTTYDELTPFVSRIRAQDRKISDQKQTLKQERETLGVITNSMREGLMLVSKDKTVVSINPSAIRMLNGGRMEPTDPVGLNYHVVNRTKEMNTCISTALEGEGCDGMITSGGKIYHIYASPTIQEDAVQGVVVIVLDETEQRMAERSRREFSANVSHELKTPLTSISGYAEMMENGMVASMDDVCTFSGIIHREAKRLIVLIEDIIRLSRIEESPAQPTVLQPVNLNELCSTALESLAPIAEKTNVKLHMQGEIPAVMGERAMLSEMIYNLCENAIKYNHPNGEVYVTLKEHDNELEVNVRDTGIGIPEESRMRVFERFYRVDKSRSKQIGGTGLGLSIVKHVVEYHTGRIELNSTPGEGTEIRVYLPK